MNSREGSIKTVTEEIKQKALHYAEVSGGYQSLVQQVMQIGAKSMMSRSFTLPQAEQVAAMMIAAIAIAKDDTK